MILSSHSLFFLGLVFLLSIKFTFLASCFLFRHFDIDFFCFFLSGFLEVVFNECLVNESCSAEQFNESCSAKQFKMNKFGIKKEIRNRNLVNP